MASRRAFSRGGMVAPEAVLRVPTGQGRRLGTAIVVSALVYLVAVGAMVAGIAISSPATRLSDQLASDPDLVAYRVPFVAAALLAPAVVTMLVLLVVARGEGLGARDLIALLFLPGYLVCSSFAYASQLAVLPRLVELGAVQAAPWYFADPGSIPMAVDLLGYAFLGVAMCLLAFGFLEREGLVQALGVTLLLSGTTSVAAFIALAAGVDALASAFTWTSAAFTLPLGLLAIALGRRCRRERSAPLADPELWV